MVERYTNQLALADLAQSQGLDKGEISYFLDYGEKIGALLVECENSKKINQFKIPEEDANKINRLHKKFSSPHLPDAILLLSKGIYGLLTKLENCNKKNDEQKRIS